MMASSIISGIKAWLSRHPFAMGLAYACGTGVAGYLTNNQALMTSSPIIAAVVTWVDNFFISGTNAVTTPQITAPQKPTNPTVNASTPSATGNFKLTLNEPPAPTGSVTISLTGGTPGSFTIYQAGLPIGPSGALTQPLMLDANGAFTSIFSLSGASTFANVITANGSVSFYALDSAGNVSNTVTLS